jgi:hypothetical protein
MTDLPERAEESLDEADRRALAESREYFREHPDGGIPFEQVVEECGLTMGQVCPPRGAC